MDQLRNPFAPGAGSAPPELAGRNQVREKMKLALDRLRIGRPAKSLLLVGLRGVGKTVLLDQMMQDSDHAGTIIIRVEAPEGRSLPAIIAPQLRLALLKLSRTAKASGYAKTALRALTGFAKSLKIRYADIEVGFDYEAEPGLADNGDLESDLSTLLDMVGQAARAAAVVVAICIDELQYVEQAQLAALISALHRCAQKRLPLTVIGAGLPQLRAKMGKAKSYAERLFDFPEIGPLEFWDAGQAIIKPIHDEGADIESEAVDLIINQTKGYPYFLQEWGKHAWDIAVQSPISSDDVRRASQEALAALDESFFRVRFDRLTPREKQYLRAMAELGPGPHRSGDVAAQLVSQTSALGPVRGSLINKGMIWSPTHGDTEFTVPLFDQFMRRIIPGHDWLKLDG